MCLLGFASFYIFLVFVMILSSECVCVFFKFSLCSASSSSSGFRGNRVGGNRQNMKKLGMCPLLSTLFDDGGEQGSNNDYDDYYSGSSRGE